MKTWFKVALFNLLVLAVLGMVLRYKINFSLPFIKQENLLHAHSHFAFNGWISFVLQLLVLQEFTNDYRTSHTWWNRFFLVSTIVNYAMIVSFAAVGYTAISIALTTAALWLSYAFIYKIYKALPPEQSSNVSMRFVRGSLFFLLLSSFGPYALSLVMASKSGHQYWYHNALYFFLHFQYNGWFTFAVLALLFKKLESSVNYSRKQGMAFFLLLAITCIPSYLFTSLWHHRPGSVTVIIIITALLQTSALFFLYNLLKKNMRQVYSNLPAICKRLYSLAIAAFILKILLQFFSIQPQLAMLAFGFRPIIIGYLHLIFLAFISMYIIGFLADKNILDLRHRISRTGLVTFATGILINELFLGMQGVSGIFYVFIPWLNLLLFANTFVMVAGAAMLFKAAVQSEKTTPQLYTQPLKTLL